MALIYKITNRVNNKVYIGQTTQPLYKRWWRHCHNGKKSVIGSAIAKYGKENFTIEVIDTGTSLEELNEKEIYWINHYNSISPNGYNIAGGGRNHIVTDALRKRLSEVHKGKGCGADNPFYGRHHTEEAKRIFSARNKNNNYAPRRKVICVETGIIYESIASATRQTKINNIGYACKGKIKHAGGYHWQYYDNEEVG